jgi:aspartate kinase
VIANAIDADSLEIWKDVDGFMSADPKVVPEACAHQPALLRGSGPSCPYFGAKVLHPAKVEPARARE